MTLALIACSTKVFADVSELTTIIGEDGYVYPTPDVSFAPTYADVTDEYLPPIESVSRSELKS